MLVSAINNSYSLIQTAHTWYWSAPTQQRLLDTYRTLIEVLTITILLLSQCYADFVTILDQWLTPGCSTEVFVITPEEGDTGWFEVWAMLQGDLAYAQTWLSYTVNDLQSAVTELYYRVRTLL